MRDLTLVVTDLYLPPEEAGEGGRKLAALERMLARSRSVTPGDWRAWVTALCGVITDAATPSALPVATISRLASEDNTRDQWWLATAVHLQAVHDHVRLTEVLSLSEEEWTMLASGYRQALGTETLQWEEGGGSTAFLRAQRALDAATTDPARSIGRDVHDALPGGPDAPQLKRLMTELQMWLYDHPLNRKRETAGLPVLNGFWFWGGGGMPVAAQGVHLPLLFSDDAFLRGLWRMAHGVARPLPSSDGAGIIAGENGQPSVLVGLALRQMPGDNDGERMEALDRHWLEPALVALRAGALREFRLHINDRLFWVRRRDLLRFWRRPRPWAEVLS